MEVGFFPVVPLATRPKNVFSPRNILKYFEKWLWFAALTVPTTRKFKSFDCSIRRVSTILEAIVRRYSSKYFKNFAGKHLCWSLFIKKKTPTIVFSWEICNIVKNTFFHSGCFCNSTKNTKFMKFKSLFSILYVMQDCLWWSKYPYYGNHFNSEFAFIYNIFLKKLV